jgi:hypothetical protein
MDQGWGGPPLASGSSISQKSTTSHAAANQRVVGSTADNHSEASTGALQDAHLEACNIAEYSTPYGAYYGLNDASSIMCNFLTANLEPLSRIIILPASSPVSFCTCEHMPLTGLGAVRSTASASLGAPCARQFYGALDSTCHVLRTVTYISDITKYGKALSRTITPFLFLDAHLELYVASQVKRPYTG